MKKIICGVYPIYKDNYNYYLKVKKDVWDNLNRELEEYNGTFEELCEELHGYNLEEDSYDNGKYFDFEYKECGMTIFKSDEDGIFLSDDVAVYDDKTGEHYHTRVVFDD